MVSRDDAAPRAEMAPVYARSAANLRDLARQFGMDIYDAERALSELRFRTRLAEMGLARMHDMKAEAERLLAELERAGEAG